VPQPDYALVRSRLSQARKREGMALRVVAEATDISAATLSRFEGEKGNPDLATLDKLIGWLGLSPADVYRTPSDDPTNTMDAIAVHLRADPKLDPRTAEALVEGFKTMYGHFTDDEPSDAVSRDASSR
jgi:transcriptional regulator with XRE-family HTH domain